MTKVIVILGSPRWNGNSEILANKAIEGATTTGGSCKVFHLNSMKISPCQACDYCRNNSGKLCKLNDNMQQIYPELIEADALLLASPIYMFHISAQLKLFMDRCYACSDDLAGKRIGILLTYGAADEYSSGAINAINTFRDEYRYTNSELIGIVHGSAHVKGEVAQNEKLLNEAFDLGKRLVKINNGL